MEVPVRDLKSRLSEYLRRVRAGERVIVTERGRPIAELAPLRQEVLDPEERMARLAEAGELQRPRGRGLADFVPVRVRGRPVSATLIEDRG
jgi:prevent-host-death family protein